MKNIHALNRPIWADSPYDNPEKLYFLIEAMDEINPIENEQGIYGIQFTLQGRLVGPSMQLEIGNRYSRLKDIDESEKAIEIPDNLQNYQLYGEISFTCEEIIRIQFATSENRLNRQTEMVVGKSKQPSISYQEEEQYIIQSNRLRLEITDFPFKIQVFEKNNSGSGDLLLFETQDINWSYISTGWNFPSGQMIDFTKRYPKISFFSTKINKSEHFYGLGEQYSSLDKREQRVYLDIEDPTTTDTSRHYKAIPFYMSTNHYGIYVNQSVPMVFDLGKDSYRGVTFEVLDDYLDFYVIHGQNMKEILDNYTDLTGKCVQMPPKWSFGLWMSRISYRSQEEVETVIKEMREHHVPFDVIHIDTDWFEKDWECDFKFSPRKFPKPEKMIEYGHTHHVKFSLWQLPYINANLDLYQQAKDAGLLATPPICEERRNRETVELTEDNNVEVAEGAGIIDFSQIEGIKWYQNLLRPLLEMGIDCIKVDFGESAHADWEYKNIAGVEMHNLYPLLYNKLQWELSQEVKGEPIIWARSAWAGSQRYPLHWAGDSKADLRSMYTTLRGGLSFGMSGFTFWSHDMGGFTPNPDEETYQRWSQFGFWTSHSRCHGAPPREPYKFSKRLFENFLKYDSMKYELAPYFYSQGYSAMKQGIPLLRPMILEFENLGDPTLYSLDDQYMLGDAFLVAPIIEYNCRERKVYLPKGLWYQLEGDKQYIGEKWITISTPMDYIPVFVKAGSIIPKIKPTEYLGSERFTDLEFHVYPKREGEIILEQRLLFLYYDEVETEIEIRIKDGKTTLYSSPFQNDFPIKLH